MSPKAPTHRTEDLPIAPSDLPMDQALSYDPSRSLLLEHLQDESLQSTVRVAEPGAAGTPQAPSLPLHGLAAHDPTTHDPTTHDPATHDPESPSSGVLKDSLLSTDSKPQSDDFRLLTWCDF